MYFQKYMHIRNLSMSEIYAYQKYMHVKNICILEIYTMSEIYAY